MAVLLVRVGVKLCLCGLVVKPGVGDNLEDLDIDGTIISKLMLKKMNGASK
jgi:hypothetical protein